MAAVRRDNSNATIHLYRDAMTEATLLQALLLRGSELGVRLFRNQVGKYQLADGRWLSSGLCIGSSDLLGWVPVTIGPEHLGRQIAVFCAVEAKGQRGNLRAEQRRFLEVVTAAGGVAGVVRSVSDWETLLTSWVPP